MPADIAATGLEQLVDADLPSGSRFTAEAAYPLETILHRDHEQILCRGWRYGPNGSRAAVLGKYVTPATPGNGALERLTNEHAARESLDSSWAAVPLEMVCEPGCNLLLLEDPGADLLERLIGSPMDIDMFLRLAAALAGALQHLHDAALVHRDIKPSNVLVDARSERVWLTGFGHALRLPDRRSLPVRPEPLAGTLAYMPPEQIGRMTRAVDGRSDLYALGVTLYEMLTGSLPFPAQDEAELVHSHMARRPVPPGKRADAIPDAVSGIVLKLLAKTAEDRYRTAAGVEADLRRCLEEWRSCARVEAFDLDAGGAAPRLPAVVALHGRDRQRKELLDALARPIEARSPAFILVSGRSGSGKSSLVEEVRREVAGPATLFATGKFDLQQRGTPYAALLEALQSVVRQALSATGPELEVMRDEVRAALGGNAQLIVDLLPDLAFVIGGQEPVAPLLPLEARARFHVVFRAFLRAVGRTTKKFVLFLDDLQWLDEATLGFLEDLATHPDIENLLLICAFRDDGDGHAEGLQKALRAMQEANGTSRIVLAPLSLSDVTDLIRAMLGCPARSVLRLARAVHARTEGNPLLVAQFMAGLCEKGVLKFHERKGRWVWRLKDVSAVGFDDNVVNLAAGKLLRLGRSAQEAISTLACLGNSADAMLLATACRMPEADVRWSLDIPIRQGLVTLSGGVFKFTHDSVQQAAYSLLAAAFLEETHLSIGRSLQEKLSEGQMGEKLFDVVDQLNRGSALIRDPAEADALVDLNLRAANRAKAAAAYGLACSCFGAATSLLGTDGWSNRYDATLHAWLGRIESEFLNGNFDVAKLQIDEVLRRSRSATDKALAYQILIDIHVLQSENSLATTCALACLKLLGVEMDPHPTDSQVAAEYEGVWEALGGATIGSLLDLPLMLDGETQAALRVLSVLLPPAVYTDRNLPALLLCRMVSLSIQHGNTDAATVGYAWFGVILGPVFRRYGQGFDFGKLACDLVEHHAFTAYAAKTYFAMEIVSLWTQPIASGLRCLQATMRASSSSGDVAFACYARNHLITDRLLQGDQLEDVWLESEAALKFARASRFRDVSDIVISQQRFILNMRGQTGHFSSFSDDSFDEAAFEQGLDGSRMTTMVCWYWILKLQARVLSGDNEAALAAGQRAGNLIWSSVGHIQTLDYFYYTALAVAALHPDKASLLASDGHATLVAAHLEQLKEWALRCSGTFMDKFELLAAEVARIEGRDPDAMRLYEAAMQSARKGGFIQNEALANEVAGRFYLSRGLETTAYGHLRNARQCFARWGALGKVRHLEARYPALSTGFSADPGPNASPLLDKLDAAAILDACQALSGEIALPALIQRLMEVTLQVAGANHAVLFTSEGNEGQVRARAWIEDEKVLVQHGPAVVSDAAHCIARYAARTQKSVLIPDAREPNPFSENSRLASDKQRSVMCLPLVKQGVLRGLLYLENTLTSHVFTPQRTRLLEAIASQAAISLENTLLYSVLKEREAEARSLVDASIIGVLICGADGLITEANQAFLGMLGYDRHDVLQGGLHWAGLSLSDLGDAHGQAMDRTSSAGLKQLYETEFVRKNGGTVPVLVGTATLGETKGRYVAFVVDLTERKIAEEERRRDDVRLAEMQAAVGHELSMAASLQEASVARELRNAAEEKFAELTAVNTALSNALSGLQDVESLDQFSYRTLTAAGSLIGALDASLFLFDGNGSRMVPRYVIQHGQPFDTALDPSFLERPSGSDALDDQLLWDKVFNRPADLWVTIDSFLLPTRSRKFHLAWGHASVLHIPLWRDGCPIGFIGLAFAHTIRPAEARIELVRLMAQQLTLAFELQRLGSESREMAVAREREASAVLRLSHLVKGNAALAASTAELSIGDNLLTYVRSLLQSFLKLKYCDSCAIWLSQPDGSKSLFVDCTGESSIMLTSQDHIDGDRGCLQRDLMSIIGEQRNRSHQQSPFAIGDVAASSLFDRLGLVRKQLVARDMGSVLDIQLLAGSRVVGSFILFSSRPLVWTAERVELAQAQANQVALTLEMGRLADLAREKAILEERHRFACDIHDTLAQDFLAIAANLQSAQRKLAKPPLSPSKVGSISAVLSQAIAAAQDGVLEARRSVWRLAPATSDTGSGLAAMIREVVQRDAPGRIAVLETGRERLLPIDVEREVVAIVREGILNACMHAGLNANIAIQLTFGAMALEVVVVDDGTGFDLLGGGDGRIGHFGLWTMRERCARIGGRLDIASAIGAGTKITLSIPSAGH